eukprot:4024799-Karenia_brevis.AAC.1
MPNADWYRHVYREHNTGADALANQAMDLRSSATWSFSQTEKLLWLCAHFDGGKRGEDTAACGWHLQGCAAYDDDGDSTPTWRTLAWGRLLLPAGTSS